MRNTCTLLMVLLALQPAFAGKKEDMKEYQAKLKALGEEDHAGTIALAKWALAKKNNKLKAKSQRLLAGLVGKTMSKASADSHVEAWEILRGLDMYPLKGKWVKRSRYLKSEGMVSSRGAWVLPGYKELAKAADRSKKQGANLTKERTQTVSKLRSSRARLKHTTARNVRAEAEKSKQGAALAQAKKDLEVAKVELPRAKRERQAYLDTHHKESPELYRLSQKWSAEVQRLELIIRMVTKLLATAETWLSHGPAEQATLEAEIPPLEVRERDLEKRLKVHKGEALAHEAKLEQAKQENAKKLAEVALAVQKKTQAHKARAAKLQGKAPKKGR